jgi:hypothetical protein
MGPAIAEGIGSGTKADTPPLQDGSQEKPWPFSTGRKTKGAALAEGRPVERGKRFMVKTRVLVTRGL